MLEFEISNEELAVRIATGEKDLVPQLWNQVERYIKQKANGYFKLCVTDGNYHFELEDLIQQSYFALLSAIEYFNPREGAFLTILTFCLKNAFAEVAGHRLGKQRNDGIRHSVSANIPLTDDCDDTILDFIPSTENTEESAVDRIYKQELHNTLENALETLSKKQADLLRSAYYKDESITILAEKYGCTTQHVSECKNKALGQLYWERHENGLEAFLAEKVDYYTKVGVRQFKNTRISATEKAVLARERFEEEYRRKKAKAETARAAKKELQNNKMKPSNFRRNQTVRELMKKYKIDKTRG